MQIIEYGNDITFTKTFHTSEGVLVDPPEVTMSIVRNVTAVMYGPFHYSLDEVTRLGEGVYQRTVLIEDVIMPGVYTAKWVVEIDGITQTFLEQFQVIEPPPEESDLLDPPRVYGIASLPNYGRRGNG
jgi:hypothetical protein